MIGLKEGERIRTVQPWDPNAGWGSDVASAANDEGWLYLTVINDLFSR